MTKHEDFSSITIEVPISGTSEKMIVEGSFWDDLRQQGVTVAFMHAGRPHVSDPVTNDRKVSVARLVMKCDAGFSARIKNADEPLNLTPSNLLIVRDGRARYRASLAIKPEKSIDLGVTPSKLLHPDWIDPGLGNGGEWEVHEDIEETLSVDLDEPMEVDQFVDESSLTLVIKDGNGLQGGIRSSRRVGVPAQDLGASNLDTTKMQLQQLYNDMARRDGAIVPSRGKKQKRWSSSYFNAGKIRKS